MSGRVLLNGFVAEDYPFKNFLKMAGAPVAQNGTYAFTSVLDSNGYITSSPGNTVTCPILLPATYSGTWRFYWTGKFKVTLILPSGTAATIIADPSGAASGGGTSNLTITAASDSYVDFTLSVPPSSINLAWVSGTYTANPTMVLCRNSSPYTGDQAAIDSGILSEQFNADFISALTAIAPRILRPLNANDPDGQANFVRWAHRKLPAAFSWGNTRWYPNALAGDSGSGALKTLNTGDAYSVTSYPDMPGSWTDGEALHVQWSATNSGSAPTLDVGSRGAKTIADMAGTNAAASALTNNTIGTVVYDSALDKLLYRTSGFKTGWPTEVICALANKANIDLWVQIPTHYDLASVQSLAACVRDNLNSNLTAYFEYSNEVWNFAAGFEQTSWASNYGAVLGFPSGSNRRIHGTYALRTVQFLPAIAAVWIANGRSRSTLKLVNAFMAKGNTAEVDLYRLKGSDLNTSLGYAGYNSIVGVSYNSSPNRPVDVADVISYAPYYSGAQCRNADGNYTNAGNGMNADGPTTGVSSPPWTTGILGAADAYAAGGATNIADALAFMDWDFRQGTRNGSAGTLTLLAYVSVYSGWETVAAGYDGARPAGMSSLTVACYEGGFEALYISTARCTAISIDTAYGGSTGKIGNLLTAYKNSPLFRKLVEDQFNQQKSGHAGRATIPGWFTFNASGSQWALFVGDLYSSRYESYNELALYNHGLRRFKIAT